MEHISSRQNPLIRAVRAVRAGRANGDEVLLDGAHLVEEACAAPRVELRVVLVDSEAAGGRLAPLVARAARTHARLATVPPALLASLSPVQHPSGVVAIARLPRATEEDLRAADGPILVLDRVQDPGNLGAIVRTAEACGAAGVITTDGSADPHGWKALRAAMGSTFRLPVVSLPDLDAAATSLRHAGRRIVAAVPRAGAPLHQVDLVAPSGILLGGEGPGLPGPVLERCDLQVTVPMRPPVESLNVAVTAALILYEAARQKSNVAVR